jgi:UDP-glucose-4-epimerase GalE
VRVVVTGGAGYIGSHAVRELLESGHEVVVLDDLSKGHRAAVASGARLITGDLADPETLRQALPGAAAVVHFAGLLSVAESVREPGAYYRVNVAKGLTLLEAMLAHGVTRIVFSSTCATYGMPQRLPMDEAHPQEPINPYGASKRAFERILQDHAAAGLLRAVALRYFNAAGCHADGSLGEHHDPEEHLIPLAIDAALGRGPGLSIHGDDYDTPDGTCIRDYIHVQDLARAHVLALERLEAGAPFRAFNLGSESGHSVRGVVEAVAKLAGAAVPARVGPRRAGDPPRLVASAARARAELGFVPRHDLASIVTTALAPRTSRRLRQARMSKGRPTPLPDPLLSVVMPVYNEKASVAEMVGRVLAVSLRIDLVAVDDASSDGSREILEQLAGERGFRLLCQERNQGKGAAVRRGIAEARGDIIVVQDADLEYSPEEYPELVDLIVRGKADAVFGSRFIGRHRCFLFTHYLANLFLNLVTNVLYNTTLTDMETCFKAVRADLLKSLTLRSNRFGIEPEITAKLFKRGARVYEVPITYEGRDYSEGKKITWRDGFPALWTLIKYRFVD